MTHIVRRYDAGTLLGMYKTPEGFYKGIARVTRTGVYTYRNVDGSLRRELRHPDEVFKKDSLDTLKMVPMTNNHPKEKLVTKDTAKELSIGYTGENVIREDKFVLVPVCITSADGVKAVEDGRQELSCGYEVELDEQPGEFNGERYDCVQQNIRYNHVAIVDRGRAGADVRLNMDADDAVEQIENNNPNTPNTRSDAMPKVRLDNGLEYEAPQEVVVAFTAKQVELDGLKVKLDAAEKGSEKLRADADTAKETQKALQVKVDGLPAAITAGVKARLSLEKIANDTLDEETIKKLDSMSDADIRKSVILAKFPEAKLDEKSDEYLNARFDAAVEAIKTDGTDDSMSKQRAKMGTRGDSAANTDCSAEKKRMDMVKNLQDAYKEGNVNTGK